MKTAKDEVRIVNELVRMGFSESQALHAFEQSKTVEIKDVIDCILKPFFQRSAEVHGTNQKDLGEVWAKVQPEIEQRLSDVLRQG